MASLELMSSDNRREGRIREIPEYCESDVLNTYRVWMRYELFRGGSSYEAFRASKITWCSSSTCAENLEAKGKSLAR
jgi:hypothetical protein